MTQKIIFLDIDGPMIPSSMYFKSLRVSHDRVFSPVCVHILEHLLTMSGAKLVTNSMHSHYLRDKLHTLRDDLIKSGISRHHFHQEWHTHFPQKLSGGSRMTGITEWQEENGEADWICFDDVKFTDDPRLIHVDFDSGLTTYHYNQAAEIFKIKPFIVL